MQVMCVCVVPASVCRSVADALRVVTTVCSLLSSGVDYEAIMRSMRTTGYQATNLGLAVEEVAAAAIVVCGGGGNECGAGEQDAALAAERRARDGAGEGRGRQGGP